MVGWYVGNGGGGGTWGVQPYGSLGYEPEGDGSRYAVCHAVGEETYRDTLVSPAVPTAGYDSLKVTFAYAFNREGYASSDFGEVLVRYHDGASWGPWYEVRSYSTTVKGTDTVPLTPGYDSVQVAFAYVSDEGAYWFAVDDVRVLGRTLLSHDVEATAIVIPEDLHYRGEYITPLVRVSNRGTTDVSLVVSLYVLYSGDTVFRGEDSFIAESGRTYDVPFGWFVPESLGTYEALLVVRGDTDDYYGNDTLRKSFKVWPYPSVVFGIPYAPPVLLDGRMGPGEWSSAYRLDVSNYFGQNSPPTDTGVAVVYLQHDGSHLNLLVITGDTTYDSTDVLYLFLDDDGDRTWERGEGLNLIGGRPYSVWATKDSGQSYVFPRKDLAPNVARLGDTFEISVPMTLGLPPDPGRLNTRVGEHISAFLAYRDGRSGRFLAWWPQLTDLSVDSMGPAGTYLVLLRPDPWHDLGVGLLPHEGCTAQRVCTTSVVIYDNLSTAMAVETLEVRVDRGGSPVLYASVPIDVSYGSVDTLHFRWMPPDSGHYEVSVRLTSDDSHGNNVVRAYAPVGRVVTPPYVQDFEGRWPPAGWRVVGRGWVQGHYVGDARVSPTFGSSSEHFAEFLSFLLPSGDSSVLYLPPLSVSTPSHLGMYVWNGPTWSGRGNYDRLDLYYRTPGSSVWYPLGSVSGDLPAWTYRTFNLPTAETLYVKVVARSDYGDTDLSIDDLSVLPGLAVGEVKEGREACRYEDGGIVAAEGSEVRVYTVDGRRVLSSRVGPEGRIDLPKRVGVYFVRCNGVVIKAVSPLK